MDLYANLHAEEVESALIGATIIHPHDDVLEAFLSVPTVAYWSPRYRIVAEAIRTLNDLEIETDLVNLTDHLRRSGQLEEVGGVGVLINIAESGSTSGAFDYAQRILELYGRRKLIDFAGDSIRLARDLS
jgi:replicative DNA helicase